MKRMRFKGESHRVRYYNRVLMKKQAESYQKFGAWVGLGFVAVLILGLFAAFK